MKQPAAPDFNVLEDFGVSHHLFEEIGYKLASTKDRVDVRGQGSGLIGSEYSGEVGGVALKWRNVKDGDNGYFWTVSVVGDGWKLNCSMSVSPPIRRVKEQHSKITLHTLQGDRERYIFRPKFEGSIDKMRRDLSLVRLFID